MISLLYRALRRLPLNQRIGWHHRLQRLGVERRLAACGAVVYDYEQRHIGVDLADHVGREMFKHGWYEAPYIDYIRAHLTDPNGAFWDIGANVGNYSLALAPCFTQTLAFEPNPTMSGALTENCRRNPDLAIRVIPVGLSSRAQTLTFAVDESGNSGQSGFREDASGDTTLSLEVAAGDDYADPTTPAALIKIDVEGHELEVLRGLQATIGRDRPAVCLEWHTDVMSAQGGLEALTLLLPRDYRVLCTTSPRHIELTRLEPPYKAKYNLIFCLPGAV